MKDVRLQEIYRKQPEKYDALVSHEDFRGKLLPAIQEITPLKNQTIAEFGAGTGRITRLLNLLAKRVIAADRSLPMLNVARQRLAETGTENWSLVSADHRNMPLPPSSVELAIAGWTFGSFVDEDPVNWEHAIREVLSEVQRILQPGGTCIIIETLGTGERFPSPPNQHLADYYQRLERENSFQSRWIRTDYQFRDLHEARELIGFFFGEKMAERVTENQHVIVPECTGIWWRRW